MRPPSGRTRPYAPPHRFDGCGGRALEWSDGVSEDSGLLKPSAEIEQLVLFGRLDEATHLYAKQAEVDEATAREVIKKLAAS